MNDFKHLTEADARQLGRQQPIAKPSKYRNVKTVVGAVTFDSRREADYWIGLQARERTGEIVDLRYHVIFPLLAPNRVHGNDVIVAEYEADFVYTDMQGNQHVVDAKGERTRMYRLKKKWLELQDGIVIEEV